jgi:hypothetical protein
MNTDKKVFEKLFSSQKTELASQAYEFALVDDIKAEAANMDGSIAKVKAQFNKAQTAMIQYNDFNRAVAGAANRVVALVKELKDKSKSLGVEAPAAMLALEKDAQSKSKEYIAKFNAVDTAIKGLK